MLDKECSDDGVHRDRYVGTSASASALVCRALLMIQVQPVCVYGQTSEGQILVVSLPIEASNVWLFGVYRIYSKAPDF